MAKTTYGHHDHDLANPRQSAPAFGKSADRARTDRAASGAPPRCAAHRPRPRRRAPPHPDLALYNAILSPEIGPEHPDFALSERYIGELEAADWVVIGTPMNNFSVPSTLKAWIDHIVRIRRTFRSTPEGKIGLLADTPVMVVSAHGGYIGGTPAYQPDFLTPYLQAIFETIGMPRVEFMPMAGLSRGPEALAKALAAAREWIDRRFPLVKADAAG